MMAEQEKTNQTKIVKIEIERMLNAGEVSLKRIYEKIPLKLGVRREVVRRVKRDLLQELRNKIDVLENKSVGRIPLKELEKEKNTLDQRVEELLETADGATSFKKIRAHLNRNNDYPETTFKELLFCIRKMVKLDVIYSCGNSKYRIKKVNK